ncbi:MAG: hypothetical protein PHF60_02440 [Candidatus ainarchaeum sp.]|nr:hypothetical protein [Candidatus ainarchaeum sp.]
MRRTTLVLLIFLLGFGCLEEADFPAAKSEQLTNTQSVDLDNDGIQDYMIYDFAPVTLDSAGMAVQRQITVYVQTNATYTSINPDLTDVDMLVADQSLEEFSKSRTQADTACSGAIGLSNVVCSDVSTCSRLCSSASLRCKKMATLYEEPLAGAMISYVQDNNVIRSRILDSRRMVLELRNASDEDRNAFLMKTREIVGSVASINANPIYTYSDLMLCTHSDFGMPFLLDGAGKIGNYSTEITGYRYRVLLSVKPTQQPATDQNGAEVSGVGIVDKVSKTAVPQPDQISSVQTVSLSSQNSDALVTWNSEKPSKEGYLFAYEFSSSQPPETVLAGLKSPEVKVRKINLAFLAPTNFLLVTINGMAKNYYVAYGAAMGITIAFIIFLYNVGVLAYYVIKEKAAGTTLTVAFRKAFGRTVVRWKTDALIAILFLGGGYYVSTVVAPQPTAIPSLIESIDFLLKSDMGMLGIAMIVIGVVMAYYTIENVVKIIILERAYGMVIRKEKDMFFARAGELKDKIKELEMLVEDYTKDDFDVSKEYDILNSLKAGKVEDLTKEVTARNKALIDEYVSRADSAVSSLKERKRIADESWPKWKESIAKTLAEQNEIYTSSLVTIPASLRAWALGRYVKEVGAEGITFERDSLRKKKIAPEQIVREMIDRNLIRGAIVLKQDKIVASEFAEGSGTVMAALTLKLNNYLQSLARNLGQHSPQSFVSIGERTVIVLMKNRAVDAVLFMNKDKFKDAVEEWKSKMKVFENG